jgi:hypothetical protein
MRCNIHYLSVEGIEGCCKVVQDPKQLLRDQGRRALAARIRCQRCGGPLSWFWESRIWNCPTCPPLVTIEEE